MIVSRLALLAIMLSTAQAEESGFLTPSSSDCPPGIVHQGKSCVCAEWPGGMIICDEDSQKVLMAVGNCMTYINKTGELRAGACPKNFFRNNSYKFYYPLPSSAADLNEDVCGPLNSKGLLCSECQEGFASSAPTSNSRIPISCVNCTGNKTLTGTVACGHSAWLPSSEYDWLPFTIDQQDIDRHSSMWS